MRYFNSKKITLYLLLLLSSFAFAGSPFLTDDPGVLDYHHYELYLFSNLTDSNVLLEEPDLQGPAFEVDWGAWPNLELHLVIPYVWSSPNSAPATEGLGDIETGFKYRFIQETDHRPQIAIAPTFELPTGDAEQNLGNGKLWMKLPIWLQKSWGTWTTYGGGGYAFNSAPQMRNYPFGGWELQKDLSEQLTLGVEVYAQGSDTVETDFSTIVNVGGYYNFTKNFSLLFAAGHSVAGEDYLVSYIGLYWTGG